MQFLKTKKTKISCDKYIIGLNLPKFLNENVKLSSPMLKKYNKLINESASNYVKIQFIYKINESIKNTINSLIVFINEHEIQNIDKYETNPKTTIIQAINYEHLKIKNNKIFILEILQKKEDVKFKNNLNYFKQYNKIKEIIEKRVFNKFPNLKKKINLVNNVNIFDYGKKFGDNEKLYLGFKNTINNPLLSKSIQSPFNNLYYASKFSSPGGEYLNSFETAYNVYNLFDIKFNGYDATLIDYFNYNNFFNLLKAKYIFNKKYQNEAIAFHFDNEISYILILNHSNLIIKKATFEEAFEAKFYIFCNFGIWKNIIQKRTSLTKEVLANNVKIKGGVFLAKKILNKCNIFYIVENDLKNHYLELNYKIEETNLFKKESEKK